jgi:hypothetical protein
VVDEYFKALSGHRDSRIIGGRGGEEEGGQRRGFRCVFVLTTAVSESGRVSSDLIRRQRVPMVH